MPVRLVVILTMSVGRSWILLRAINLLIDEVEKLHDKSQWTRVLEGTKDAVTVLKAFRDRLAVYATSFRWAFRIVDMAVRYIDRLAKIDTQLHTEVKVEEIFKVISSKHE